MATGDIESRVGALFETRFGRKPEWIVRCPGRVNLIGEHIDYSGYGVLPMAIEQSTYLAIGSSSDGLLRFANIDSAKYEPFECASAEALTSQPPSTCKWYHYFIAGWRGMKQHLHAEKCAPTEKVGGTSVAIDSSIPPSAGLSSSSALVCASALATYLEATGPGSASAAFDKLSRTQLAEVAITSERFVGTEGGGMDQACECLASAGSALRIDFNPLKSHPIKLPQSALFAVVHSGVEMNKAATAYYNERVVECRIAAQLLCRLSGNTGEKDWNSIRTLQDAQKAFKADNPSLMLPHLEKHLGKLVYSRKEVCEALGIGDEDLRKHSLNSNTQEMEKFKLRQRARHVFTEAQRVLDFEDACTNGDGIEKLAALMNQSHRSCAEDFECSCPELDQTVKKSMDAGCIGARLTGAGWGGCCVVLVEKSRKSEIAGKLDVLFWTEPSGGIEVASHHSG